MAMENREPGEKRGRLAGKTAIVTGAGSVGPGWGNGRAISKLFADEGAAVLGLDMDPAALDETKSLIAEDGGVFHAELADVSKAGDVERAVERALDLFGGRIDILVNNVGIVRLGGVTEIDEATWDRVVEVNLKSFYLVCRNVLPAMERQGKGAIVNISSIAAIRSTGISYSSYYATKGAIPAFSRGMAVEYAARGIRVNTVLPGLMDTPLIYAGLADGYNEEGDAEKMRDERAAQCPMGRMGTAFDVAYAALYLASDEAAYVTAAELVVDGGITAKFS